MSMVAQLAFEEDGVRYFCSGSLVSTRDNSFIPYLLTAGTASTVKPRRGHSKWTYQTASCGGPPPASRSDSTKSTQGAHLIDWAPLEGGDFSLLLLRDVPPGVTFAGWDADDPGLTSGLVGVHHPAGSWKRISFGERVGDRAASIDGASAPADRYLQVLWDKGRTEPGSSGSPLFSSPGVIVGTLTYGPVSNVATACEISPSIDGYGRFSNVYLRLRDYLENLPAAGGDARQGRAAVRGGGSHRARGTGSAAGDAVQGTDRVQAARGRAVDSSLVDQRIVVGQRRGTGHDFGGRVAVRPAGRIFGHGVDPLGRGPRRSSST